MTPQKEAPEPRKLCDPEEHDMQYWGLSDDGFPVEIYRCTVCGYEQEREGIF